MKLSKILKLFFSFLTMIILSSQNQTWVGVKNAYENLWSLPGDAIDTALSDRAYRRIAERNSQAFRERRLQRQRSLNSCHINLRQSHPLVSRRFLDELMQQTRSMACSCVAWGTCPQEICACDKLCPNNFDIFLRPPRENRLEDLTKPENSLSFRNESSAFTNTYEMTNGYCWGHASMTSKFNRLASFNPNDTVKKDQLKSSNPRIRSRARNSYRGLIRRIYNNEVVDIPGYRNLQEFSRDPDIQSLIAAQITEAWGENAMSLQGLGAVTLGGRPMSSTDSDSLINKVRNKVARNQQPQIMFSKEGDAAEAHAVLVSHVKVVNGKHRLCVRDNNYPPSRNHSCENYIEKEADGSLKYRYRNNRGAYIKQLGQVFLAHNDNRDALDQFRNLREHCLEERGCD